MTIAENYSRDTNDIAGTSGRGGRHRLLAAGTAAALIVVGSASAMTAPARAAVSHASSDEFDSPSGLALANGDLWVTNKAGNSVTEIDPTDGSLVATLSGAAYGFDAPTAITAAGADLFVANSKGSGGSVTEIDPTDGAVVAVISGSRFRFHHPVAIAVSGSTLLVLSKGGTTENPSGPGSITEINTSNRVLIRVISGSKYGLDDPVAIAVSGSDAFVADNGNNSVTEVTIHGGALANLITGGGLDGPDGVGVSSGYVWVSDSLSNAATQIDAASGAIVGTYNDGEANYGFGSPSVVIGTASDVYITSPFGTSPMVTNVNATSAAPYWFECDTNTPDPLFSQLSALAVDGDYLWVASSTGANNPYPDATTGSLTEISLTTGTEVQTVPSS